MNAIPSFSQRLNECLDRISPAEQRVARFFQENREETLIASASELARRIGTSDATVVRTAKTLGFAGMNELRRRLADELREDVSPAGRMARTLHEAGEDTDSALTLTLDIHRKSLEALGRDVTPDAFRSTVGSIIAAKRVFIFGIGPSSPMADYLAIQLARFGIEAQSLTQTGLLLADGLQKLKQGDLLIIFAYGRVYRELATLLDEAERRGTDKILVTDTLGPKLRDRVDLVLPVARGRADMFSMHTATLALIEALLVGVAIERPDRTMESLESLNRIRSALAGKAMGLPVSRTALGSNS